MDFKNSAELVTTMNESTIHLEPEKIPVHLDVELSSKCNLRCRFCHLSYFKPVSWDQISLNDFKNTIGPILPKLNSITLFNKFEALTCRDFIPIFNFIAEHEVETYFSTNGLLLDDEIIETIVGRLTYLTVSVTGFTAETYHKNMKFDGFEKVRKNLGKLNVAKKRTGSELPILRISTVGMLDTLNEIPKAIDFAKEFKAAEGVQLTSFKAYGSELRELMPLHDIKAYKHATDDAIKYANKKGVKLTLQSGDIDENESSTEDLGHRFCDLPWHRLSVQANGDVYPCPMAYSPIGNTRNDTLKQIWISEELAKFRYGVNKTENMNADCVNCTHCRHRSLTKVSANDFSKTDKAPTGLTRVRD